MHSIRLGAGAGFAGDRIEPAIELAKFAQLDYLIFEALAERTIALAQQRKRMDPNQGFDLLFEPRLRAVLKECVLNQTKIITNMGAANPKAAAKLARNIVDELGFSHIKIAYVTGDDVTHYLQQNPTPLLETGKCSSELKEHVISANAYLGVSGIVSALQQGADIVITGRVADPALYLAPCVYEFKWAMEDWEKLGKGTAVGHLLECAGQLTGGYYADPVKKPVANLARLGFPFADVTSEGEATFSKLTQSGGELSVANCTEQLLYEIYDPKSYLTPDVSADFSQVKFQEISPSVIKMTGACGCEKTDTFKVSIGYWDGFIGEGQISYAGPAAKERAQLALDIVQERLSMRRLPIDELRMDLIGVNALHGNHISQSYCTAAPYEVRLRVTARAKDLVTAQAVGNEVESLYTNGPAGGGGATKSVREVVAVASALLPQSLFTSLVKVWSI